MITGRIDESIRAAQFAIGPLVSPVHLPAPTAASDVFEKFSLAEGTAHLDGSPLPLSAAMTARSVEDFCNAVRHEHQKLAKRAAGTIGAADYEAEIGLLKEKCSLLAAEGEGHRAALVASEAELAEQRRVAARQLAHPNLDISRLPRPQRGKGGGKGDAFSQSSTAEGNTVAKVPTADATVQCTIIPEKRKPAGDRLFATPTRGGAKRAGATAASEGAAAEVPPPVVSPLNERSPPLMAASSGSTAAYRVAASTGQDDALYYQLQWMQRNGGVKQNLSSSSASAGGNRGGPLSGARPIRQPRGGPPTAAQQLQQLHMLRSGSVSGARV